MLSLRSLTRAAIVAPRPVLRSLAAAASESGTAAPDAEAPAAEAAAVDAMPTVEEVDPEIDGLFDHSDVSDALKKAFGAVPASATVTVFATFEAGNESRSRANKVRFRVRLVGFRCKGALFEADFPSGPQRRAGDGVYGALRRNWLAEACMRGERSIHNAVPLGKCPKSAWAQRGDAATANRRHLANAAELAH